MDGTNTAREPPNFRVFVIFALTAASAASSLSILQRLHHINTPHTALVASLHSQHSVSLTRAAVTKYLPPCETQELKAKCAVV